tara:strand:- start:100 stop:681 length:582 start_codon:yes stop_codon:yes gene_type:complete
MRISKQNLKKLIKEEVLFSEGLKYHVREDIPLMESVYRPGSKAFFDLINEARARYFARELALTEDDADLVESDLGQWGVYEGREVALDFPISEEADAMLEAEYRGRKVKLNKPKRGGRKKFYVYVRDPKTKRIKKISFGQKGMTTGLRDPKRRKSFRNRHRCKQTHDKTKASYWSCRIGRYPKVTGAPYVTWW